jgi:NitT/TauT family transport system substrate-binding protein
VAAATSKPAASAAAASVAPASPAAASTAASAAVTKPAASSPQAAAKPAASGGKPITIAWTAVAADYGPLWIAADKGFFDKRGANVKVQFIEVAASFQALAAHDIDVLATAADPSLRAQRVDVKYFGSPMHALPFGLYGKKGLGTTPDALAGKTVAATSAGSATDIFAHEAIAKLGVDPAKMKFIYTQAIPPIYAGIDAGQFDIAPLPAPFAFTAEANPSLVKLASIGSVKVPFMTAAPLAYTDWIRSHEAEAKGILQGYQEAITFARSNADETQAILSKYLKIDDKQVLKQSYDLAIKYWGVPDLAVDRDALKLAIDYGSKINPAVSGLTVDEFIYDDNKIAKSLAG